MQELLQMLADMGIGTYGDYQPSPGFGQGNITMFGDFMDIADISPGEISQNLQSYFGLTGADLPSNLFSPISQESLIASLGKTYSPLIETVGKSNVSDLIASIKGKTGKTAHGGFSGSGQSETYVGGVKDVYGKEMANILSQVGQQRTGAISNITDLIRGWRETGASIAGSGTV